jgi:hypothetical protein
MKKVSVVANSVKKGNLAVVSVKDGNHQVLAYAVDGDRFIVNDPLYDVISYAFSEVSTSVIFTKVT